jgi:asparagine synthase (glutamine-hydrolysing)
MGEAMRARGPDGDGLWLGPAGDVGLAHRRLSIIDLSERAAQPMVSADGLQAIAFNGEIYNYRALRRELEREGVPLRSESDTEVLLELYRLRGEEMLEDLRGMFALAIWDQELDRVLLARDPFGIKPLYYADAGEEVRFASQVQALLAGGVSRQPSPAGLVGTYLLGSAPEPHTFYRDIRALPAGSALWLDRRRQREPRRYFNLAAAWRAARDARSPVPDDVAMREALLDSVRHHMVADVPVGAFLSAGVDSGALLGLMAEVDPRPVQAVTVAFAEYAGTDDDEAPLAGTVASGYGADHSVRRVTAEELETDLPAILAAMDQPTVDGINTWFASKAARERGLKVAVSGLGGDELWGGYPAFRDVPRWRRLVRHPSRVPRLGAATRRAATPLIRRSALSPKLAGMLEYGGSWEGAWLLRRGIFMPWELDAVMDPELARQGLTELRPLELVAGALEPDPGTDFGRVAVLESALYMRNQLLRDTDWASMAHSLEVRVPLVDTALLARVAPLVLRKGGMGKAALAACPRPALPRRVVHRPKTGFTTPIASWLERSRELDLWRRAPRLHAPHTHWSRRLLHAVVQRRLA